MTDITNTFDSDEQLAAIETEITGAESATLDDSDYSETENDDGTYTYEAVYTADADGEYTFELVTAEDEAGNDGGGAEETIEIGESGTLVDDFEDSGLDGWSNTDDYERTTSVASAGDGSMEFLASKDTDFGNTVISVDSPGEFEEVWVDLRVEEYDGEPEFSVGEYADDSTGDDGPRIKFADGDTGSSGAIYARDGGDYVDTGISWPETGTFYELKLTNIDWSNYTFDIIVNDLSGNEEASATGVDFTDDEATQVSEFKFNGQDGVFYVDEVYHVE